MKALAGATLAAAVLLVGCGGSSGEPTISAAVQAEAAGAIAAANTYQQAFLDRDPEAACAMLTGEAKRGLAEELELSTDCEINLGTAFDLYGPEEDAELREAMRATGASQVEIDGEEATVALPSGRAIDLQRVEGRWYVADTDTSG